MSLLYNFFIIIIMFISFSSLTSVFLSINSIYSVFSMILVFVTSAVLLFLYGAEFTPIVLTTLYVGAVSVFFIFVLMTINLRFEDSFEYFDEVYKDRNFSLFFLVIFSVLAQSVILAEFNSNFGSSLMLSKFFIHLKLKGAVEYPSNFKLNGFFRPDTTNELNNTASFLGYDFKNYGNAESLVQPLISFNEVLTTFKLYPAASSEIILIGASIYKALPITFVVVTFILFFSMISAIGFAVRSK